MSTVSSLSYASHKPINLASEFHHGKGLAYEKGATTLYKSSGRKFSSGNLKTRLIMEGLDDRKYAIFAKAVSSKSRNNVHAPKISNPFTNRRFVLLRVQEPDSDQPVWVLANIGSLSKRLGIDKKEIREAFKAGTLEETIQSKIDELNGVVQIKKKKKTKTSAKGAEAPKVSKKKKVKTEDAGKVEEASKPRKKKKGTEKKGAPGTRREALRAKEKGKKKAKGFEEIGGGKATPARPKRKPPQPPKAD